PGDQRKQQDRDVVPEGLGMMVEVCGKAREVVLEDEFAEELRVSKLYRDVPGKHYGQKEHNPCRPRGFYNQFGISYRDRIQDDYDGSQKRRDRSFGQRS